MAVFAGIYGDSKPRYEGCVIDKYEHNGYHDSYWYAVCWDKEKGRIVDVEYDTTAGAGGGSAEIDATEETLREVYRMYKKSSKEYFDTYLNKDMAKAFKVGDTVIVTRGRKVPKGTIGKVFWIGERYNQFIHRNELRAGIEIDGEKIFLPHEYLAKENWESCLLTGKARKDKIRKLAVSRMPLHYRKFF